MSACVRVCVHPIVRDHFENTLEQAASRLTPSGRRSRAELTPHARGPATLSIQRWRQSRGMKPSTREIPPPLLSTRWLQPPVQPTTTQPPSASSPLVILSSLWLSSPLFGQPLLLHSVLLFRDEFAPPSTEFDFTLRRSPGVCINPSVPRRQARVMNIV